MSDITEDKVCQCAESLNPSIFGMGRIRHIDIGLLPQGLWNYNYLVTLDGNRFVFKVFSENVPGLMIENKGDKEYHALKLLADSGVTPKPCYFGKPAVLGLHLLIYEYVDGSQLKELSEQNMDAIAEALAKIHCIQVMEGLPEKHETLGGMLSDCKHLLEMCRSLDAATSELEMFDRFVKSSEEYISSHDDIDHPMCISHGDLAPSNIIINSSSGKVTAMVIDWQDPSLRDPAFDVWAVTSEPFNAWDLDVQAGDDLKQKFRNAYLKVRPDPTLLKRIQLKEPMYHLLIAAYCLYRDADKNAGNIPEERIAGREYQWKKYRKAMLASLNRLKEIFKRS